MRPTSVFRLQMGEDYEGARITQLYYIWEDAVAQAEKWVEDSTFEWKSWYSEDRDVLYWHGGCDWITLKEVDIY